MNYSHQATLWCEFRASRGVPEHPKDAPVLPPSTPRPVPGRTTVGQNKKWVKMAQMLHLDNIIMTNITS